MAGDQILTAEGCGRGPFQVVCIEAVALAPDVITIRSQVNDTRVHHTVVLADQLCVG